MGVKEWLKAHSSSSKTLPNNTPEQTLGEHGVQVARGSELRERMAALSELEDELTSEVEEADLKKFLKIWEDRTNRLLHGCIRIASPYARSGSNDLYARKLRGLTQMGAISDWWFDEAKAVIDQDNAETIIHMAIENVRKFIWKDLFYYLGICFQTPDIAPQAVAVIQSMQPMRSQGIDLNQEANKL